MLYWTMRLVFDTDVVVAALRSPAGASAALIAGAIDGRLEFALSVPLVLEYEAVCLRPEQLYASGLDVHDVVTVVDALIATAVPVSSYYSWRPQLRDAGDELVLDAAVNGGATHLVTFNLGDFGRAPQQFGIRSLRPADMLRLVRSRLA